MATARCFPSLPLSSRLLHLHPLLPISQSRLTLTQFTLVKAGFVNSRIEGTGCYVDLLWPLANACYALAYTQSCITLGTWKPGSQISIPPPPLRHTAPSTRKDTPQIGGETSNIPPSAWGHRFLNKSALKATLHVLFCCCMPCSWLRV